MPTLPLSPGAPGEHCRLRHLTDKHINISLRLDAHLSCPTHIRTLHGGPCQQGDRQRRAEGGRGARLGAGTNTGHGPATDHRSDGTCFGNERPPAPIRQRKHEPPDQSPASADPSERVGGCLLTPSAPPCPGPSPWQAVSLTQPPHSPPSSSSLPGRIQIRFLWR